MLQMISGKPKSLNVFLLNDQKLWTKSAGACEATTRDKQTDWSEGRRQHFSLLIFMDLNEESRLWNMTVSGWSILGWNVVQSFCYMGKCDRSRCVTMKSPTKVVFFQPGCVSPFVSDVRVWFNVNARKAINNLYFPPTETVDSCLLALQVSGGSAPNLGKGHILCPRPWEEVVWLNLHSGCFNVFTS